MFTRLRPLVATLALVTFSSAHATNGMNMEGYGPIAAGMGGAGLAYDNGTAALMNNPATLALAPQGTRLDLAAGFLGPHVKANGERSDGDAYFMPALGLVRKQGDLAFGLGIFAQGGMGTEYPKSSFYGSLRSMMGGVVADPGRENRSELGVGRVIFPLAWQANERFTIGGSLDFVWATLDLKMLVDGARFADMMVGSQRFGRVQPNAQMMGMMGMLGDIQWGYFDFSDGNDFSGAAKAHGWAGKIGGTYKITQELTAGFSYHSKTHLSDLEANSASVAFSGSGLPIPATMAGKVSIRDFQWPDQIGFGLSYTPDSQWQFAADYRRIGWKSVMKAFQMSFVADSGATMDMTLNQNWKDQHVLMLGAAYKLNPKWTLRGGLNVANNPVPEAMTNPLFPAIVRNHLTAGFGHVFENGHTLDFAATWAPAVKVNSDYSGTTISHGQTNAQIMYAIRF